MIPNLKVLLLGDAAVGKTAIIHQYINKSFNQEIISTVGLLNSKKKIMVNEKEVLLNIWDTPGQERYFLVTKNSIQNSDIVILVCDLTNKESFLNLNKYYQTISDILDLTNIIIGIAANKSDINNKELINFNEIEDYSKTIQADAFFTSAKDYECIEKMFFDLTLKYNEQILKSRNFRESSNILLEEKTETKKKECCKK
jgi:small GTP-binding protein